LFSAFLSLRRYLLRKLPFPETHRLYEGIVDGKNNRLYFFCKDDLVAIDLMTLEQKVIYTKPADYEHHVVSTCDGSQYVYTSISESAALKNHSFSFPKDEDYVLPKPDSFILRIHVDGSGYEDIFHDKKWLAHVNVCPTDENKITFCHEGRWRFVDHRIWGMDVTQKKVWKITDLPGYAIGHEYWYADGKRIGFHGQKDRKMIGYIDFEDTNMNMIEFDYDTMHTYSLDEKLIVGDGAENDPYLRLWRRIGDAYEEPRALAMHGCTFKTQSAHVHPRFMPDGKSILYTSDMGGYEQVYLVKIPDIDSLPFLKEENKK